MPGTSGSGAWPPLQQRRPPRAGRAGVRATVSLGPVSALSVRSSVMGRPTLLAEEQRRCMLWLTSISTSVRPAIGLMLIRAASAVARSSAERKSGTAGDLYQLLCQREVGREASTRRERRARPAAALARAPLYVRPWASAPRCPHWHRRACRRGPWSCGQPRRLRARCFGRC